MDVNQFGKLYGKEALDKLAADAGTTPGYINHLRVYFKRPSTDLALRLIKASDNRLTLAALIIPKMALATMRALYKKRPNSEKRTKSIAQILADKEALEANCAEPPPPRKSAKKTTASARTEKRPHTKAVESAPVAVEA